MSTLAKQTISEPTQINTIKEAKQEQSFLSFFYRKDVKWVNVVLITTLHLLILNGLLTFSFIKHWKSVAWAWAYGYASGCGVTVGAHRYWTHKSYKANTVLRIILAVLYSMSGLNKIHSWVRDHRVHHKYTETDADPHNSKRGFFFSHVGWLMLDKHPEVLKKGQQLDMSDIKADSVVSFFDTYFIPLKIILCFVFPISVPVIFWNEIWYWAIMTQLGRYLFMLHCIWSVNSFAHFYGNKPYDKNMAPVENAYVSFIALGEGWHNYHHAFPTDYRTSELCGGRINFSTIFIDFFAKLGWAYDRTVPPESLVKETISNRGDGTHLNTSKKLKSYL